MNKFYRLHRFNGKARRNNPCAAIRTQSGMLVAAGYLRQYSEKGTSSNQIALNKNVLPSEYHSKLKDGECCLLSGIAVAKEHQRLGLARQLIQFMTSKFNRNTFTFPYEHLIDFYLSIGFERFEKEASQPVINRLFSSYTAQGRKIILMKYEI